MVPRLREIRAASVRAGFRAGRGKVFSARRWGVKEDQEECIYSVLHGGGRGLSRGFALTQGPGAKSWILMCTANLYCADEGSALGLLYSISLLLCLLPCAAFHVPGPPGPPGPPGASGHSSGVGVTNGRETGHQCVLLSVLNVLGVRDTAIYQLPKWVK